MTEQKKKTTRKKAAKKTTRKKVATKKATRKKAPAPPPAPSASTADTEPPLAPAPVTEANRRPAKPKPRKPLDRQTVFSAVHAEVRERGMSARDSQSVADDICDRLRLGSDSASCGAAVPEFIDLRDKQDFIYPGDKRKSKMRAKGIPVMRSPQAIDSIVIHQTACEFGVSKRAMKLHGDAETARAHRALDVACHALAFRNGYYVASHDLRVHVNHGNRFNDRSLGLEIEGRYPGLMDDPSTVAREDLRSTWGGEPTQLTDQTVATACAALKWLVDEGMRYGMPIKYIYAHRQSSDTRRSDPGEELWSRVVLGYAVKELGLQTQPSLKLGRGYTIPKQWDSMHGVGGY